MDEVDAEAEVEAVAGFEMELFPLTWPILLVVAAVAGTEPKDLTPSDLMAGVAAGDDEMGAEASSIEPNVTAEPTQKVNETVDRF